MESGDGEELVERGSFRVDRARALEKLSRFQLGDPAFGPCFWVRCAVASGAENVDFDPGLVSFTLSFDGRPFSRDELQDPYAALFTEGASSRARHLAYGLLWAFRLEPSRVTLVSGHPGDRFEFSAEGPAAESVRAVQGGGGTFLTVSGLWKSAAARPWSPDPEFFAARLGACPARVRLKGRDVPRPLDLPGWSRFELPGGAWALMRPSTVQTNRRSSAVVHVDGVAAGRFDYPARSIPSECLLEAPGLPLDASQTQAVRDAALDELLSAAAGRERALLEPLLAEGASLESLHAEAIRASCRLLLADAALDCQDRMLAALWNAPLYRYTWGGPHSLLEVVARPGLDKDLVGLTGTERGELAAFLTRVRRVP